MQSKLNQRDKALILQYKKRRARLRVVLEATSDRALGVMFNVSHRTIGRVK